MTERIKYFRTHAVTKSFENASIYPAHAGINRQTRRDENRMEHLPRTRGDKPELRGAVFDLIPSTPHTRG